MLHRPRRLRMTSQIRDMIRETKISPSSLIYPMFIDEGEEKKDEIVAMPGQYRYSIDRCYEMIESLIQAGIQSILLFGIPHKKDAIGSQAYATDGIVQQAVRAIKKRYPKIFIITDVCMCEYTSHGHCGILQGHEVDNDKTLSSLQKIALSHVQAGADMVAPSDMMDQRVLAIRKCLDQHGYPHIPIMSYSVKYASAFYGPFRTAADSAPKFGDRKSYQMDVHNRREAIKEALLDVQEGADILIVKPAMNFLDIVREVREQTHLPIATYSVSGEYAMVKAAAKAGFIDEDRIVAEMAISAFRAGSDMYITYYAKEIAKMVHEGIIG